jgi:hypothetical protein
MRRAEVRKMCQEVLADNVVQGEKLAQRAGKCIAFAAIIEELLDEVEAKEAALQPFAAFLDWLEACEERGEFKTPLTDHSIICQVSAGGGSDALHVGDLRRARAAVERAMGQNDAPTEEPRR